MAQSYFKNKYIKNKINKYYKDKKKNTTVINTYTKLRGKNIMYKIMDNLSNRIYIALNRYNIKKNFKYNELLGCSIIDLKEHLEKQFTEGMTFSNYGEWELDHIIPVSKFDLTNDFQLKKCFEYKNLQPLWKKDNRKKSNKII
jgi:hypothetical protein